MAEYFDILLEKTLDTSTLDIALNPSPREVAQMFYKSTLYRMGDHRSSAAALRGVVDADGNYYVADAYAGVHVALMHRLGKAGVRFDKDTHFIIYGDGEVSGIPYWEKFSEDDILIDYSEAIDKMRARYENKREA